ncbi:hypothetical protein V498_09938 [Pseudogymnoascus sp. VKM F-4517 (FW-2822)]|nr:hypothetical protein V498_09938 [Pseudogymnoascus sp. VKM F-4517 (FW-2822)]
MKFFADIALYLTIFDAAVQSQNIKHDVFIIYFRYAERYIPEFGLTADAYLDNHPRGVEDFVNSAQEIVETF